MRLSVTQEEQGLHPSEIIVKVDTRDGPQFLALNKSSLDQASTIDIGEPVGAKVGYFLIELPAETSSGAWRVWVREQLVIKAALEAVE
jgi:hypothetical protein